MDFFTLFSVVAAVGAVLGGHYIEGGELYQLLNLPAALIVIGGSVAASAIQTSRKDFFYALNAAALSFKHKPFELNEQLEQLISLCDIAHKKGLLALEKKLPEVSNAYMVYALRLVIDGYSLDNIRAALETDMISFENKQGRAARVFDAMGGYAPTLGIIGAVLGLIHVLGNMSDPEHLGAGIATAFVATIYGVAIANLFCIPLANKIKADAEESYQHKEMILEAVLLIADGKPSHVLRSRLKGYLI